jgi:hypothetical protein
MTTLRRHLMAMLLLAAAASPVHATEVIVDSEAGCLAIGGQMVYTTHCHVDRRLVVPAGTRVVLDRSFSLTVTGPVFVDGILQTDGRFDPNGGLTNRGTLLTRGTTVNGGLLVNEATWVNEGWLHPHAGVVNTGEFTNDGYFETCGGGFENRGLMHNRASIENWSGWMLNAGIWVNDGDIYNPEGDSYRFVNRGALENNWMFWNEGLLTGECGSVWYGDGYFSGIPLAYEPCAPAIAAERLTDVVLGFGPPQADVLTKDDTISLTESLARAAKRLDAHNDPAAEAALRQFIDDVASLSGTLPPHISRALVAWAERILELMDL